MAEIMVGKAFCLKGSHNIEVRDNCVQVVGKAFCLKGSHNGFDVAEILG